MADSTRYFQLTPDILVEYKYNELSNTQEQDGNVTRFIQDLHDKAYIINNSYNSTRTFFWDIDKNDITNNSDIPDIKNINTNFVLPVNKSESKFVKCTTETNEIWNGADTSFRKSGVPFQGDDDILVDDFILHFTSRNYLGSNSYDGFILTVYIYDKVKNKIGLLSHYFRKTDDPDINHTPVLINQKLYTTSMNFRIPNVHALFNFDAYGISYALNDSELILNDALSPKHGIMDNTPIVMNIYGVKSTITKNGYEYLITEKINSIFIPIIDKADGCNIEIDSATDGDYFDIYPKFKGERISFSDYVYNISKDETGVGRPELYVVFYEVAVTEFFTDNVNNSKSEITHREQLIINAINDDGTVNEEELDRHIYFRPVLRYASRDAKFTINVKTHILNTLDNTTILLNSEQTFGLSEVKKYGKRMNRIYLGDIPAQVNVYNKKPDIDIDGVKITNTSSSVKIENHQHSVIGFIECANVGVSIEQIPTEQLQ